MWWLLAGEGAGIVAVLAGMTAFYRIRERREASERLARFDAHIESLRAQNPDFWNQVTGRG